MALADFVYLNMPIIEHAKQAWCPFILAYMLEGLLYPIVALEGALLLHVCP